MKYTYAALAIASTLAPFTMGWSQETSPTPGKRARTAEAKDVPPITLPSVDEARREAEILHTAMDSTLHHVHERYYRADEGLPLPAAILKDIFADVEKERHIKLRWLAVDGRAMNVDHRPESPFEVEAVKALQTGERAYERAEGGVYRRAAAIKLTNHCLKCHVPDRKSLEDRTAGLIISIPIKK